MVKLQPTREQQATPEVQVVYQQISQALKLHSVPLFFQFLGSFPDYLLFLSPSILDNLKSPKYQQLIDQNSLFVQEVFRQSFPKQLLAKSFIETNQHTPEFYNLKSELQIIFVINGKLMFLFLAIREAVKGWAVAARKLESHHSRESSSTNQTPGINHNYEEQLTFATDLIPQTSSDLATPEQHLTRTTQGLSQALLPKYLSVCETEFQELLKSEALLYFRVELERIAINSLESLPYPVFSPINRVLEIAKKYPQFPDLLYLLTEHFPTYAVQRYLFSGYMLF